MNDENLNFLALLKQPPARFTVAQTACFLNCQPHDIPVLTAAKLLKPLGNPPQSGVKFFAASELLEKARDPAWLARVTNAIHLHWKSKNGRKKKYSKLESYEGGEPI